MKKQLTKIEVEDSDVWGTTAAGKVVLLAFLSCDESLEEAKPYVPADQVYDLEDAELVGLSFEEAWDLMALPEGECQ